MKILRLAVSLVSTALWFAGSALAENLSQPSRPVLWYCLHYQAPGENRYPADGAYRDILTHLGKTCEVRVSAEQPTSQTLKGVDVVLIANPNAVAVGTNPPPHHVEEKDRKALIRFVRAGGGLIMMGNQENHNLEINAVNRLLHGFGLAFRNDFTDIKAVTFPPAAPAVGGMKWAFYSGNRIEILPANRTQRSLRTRSWFNNSSNDRPAKGDRSAAGSLIASSEPGKGRVIAVGDSGWIANNAMNGTGINGFYIADHQNPEIMTRMVLWAGRSRRVN